jgi:hypothetical protein
MVVGCRSDSTAKLVFPPAPSAMPALPTCASKPWIVEATVAALNSFVSEI